MKRPACNAYCLVYITTLSIQNFDVDLFLSVGLSTLNWEVAAEIIFLFLTLKLSNCLRTYAPIIVKTEGGGGGGRA